MNTPKQHHDRAMELAQKALVARHKGDADKAFSLTFSALEHEANAAFLLLDRYDAEPTRSILFRSAASLALELDNHEYAERLIAMGLSGNGPEAIKDELRNLLEDVNLTRHLEVQDIDLSTVEIQMSLSGSSVGYGLVNGAEVFSRYKKLELLTMRTAERKLGRAYRTSGQPSTQINSKFQTFLSVPRAASFAITIRIGTVDGSQLEAFEDNLIESVIDEVFQGIQWINEGNSEDLRLTIKDEAYFQNFVSLTKAIAPDGDKIKQVGFTIKRNNSYHKVGLIRRKSDINIPRDPEEELDVTRITGFLRAADANNNKITLLDRATHTKHAIKVPEGLNDIVKEYWDTEVIATIKPAGKGFSLLEIDPL